VKTRFLSIIVMTAVCLGLLLVPAVSTTLAVSWDAGLVVTPSKAKVGFNEAFTVDISIDNSDDNDDVNTVGAIINFTPGLINVTAITVDPTWTLVTGKTYDNTKGWIDIAAGIMGSSTSASTIPVATIDMVSNNAALSGIASIDIVVMPGVRESAVMTVLHGDILNWSMVVNGTVKVGKAELTVDVNPALKGDVDIAGVGIPAAYPNTTKWDWDTVVTLTATDPAAGWVFDQWSGDLSGSSSTDTVTMSVDRSVTANFVELPPSIGVSPDSLSFVTYEGVNPVPQTFDITNEGGGTLHWAVAPRPVWSPTDKWTYYNGYLMNPAPPPYIPWPGYNMALPGSFNNTLWLNVTGTSGCDYLASANFLAAPPHMLPGAQRTMKVGIPIVVWNATAWIDQQTLDYNQQIANLSVFLGGPPLYTQALVQWQYLTCEHGWPYELSKAWMYNLNIHDPLGWANHTGLTAMVTGENVPIGGFNCYEITHFDPNMTPFMQQYWSDSVKNFVYQWDGGTYDPPAAGGAVDVRSLVGMNFAPVAPAGPPAWLSAAPLEGCLVGNKAVSGSDTVTVAVNVSGLGVGTYPGIINVTDPCASVEPVSVSLTVKPATYIPSVRNLPGNAMMPNQTYVGDTFDVWVNFTASADGLNSIGLTDVAPDGWIVQVDKTWCTPNAYAVQTWGNEVEIMWSGPYSVGDNFSARYTVTVPVTATPGINTWEKCPDMTEASLEYYFGEDGPFQACISGEYQLIVTVPGDIVGETRDVNAAPLSDVNVMLLKQNEGYLRADSSTPNYSNTAYRTGMYFEHSTKALYYDINMTNLVPLAAKWIDLSDTALLAAGYVFDFEGNYGLVPKACSMAYALKSVNLWLFPPAANPEWGIDEWKAMDSIHSWQFPS